MTILQFIAALVAILAWPACVLFCFLVIRREVRKIRGDRQ